MMRGIVRVRRIAQSDKRPAFGVMPPFAKSPYLLRAETLWLTASGSVLVEFGSGSPPINFVM